MAQLGTSKINSTFILFLAISVISIFYANSIAASDDVFEEDIVYSKSAGWHETRGRLKMTRIGNVHHFEFPILFVGAGLFSRVAFEQVKQYSKIKNWTEGADKFFGTNAFSLDRIPGMKERIATIIDDIEDAYNTEFCDLKIIPYFIDEREILSKEEVEEQNYNNYFNRLYNAARKYSSTDIKQFAVPVIIAASPPPDVATPNLWDPYNSPILFAHELGHLLGIFTEGYEYSDYPPNGVMNDERAFIFLKQIASIVKIKIQLSDFNEIFVSNFGVPYKWMPLVNEDLIIKKYSKTSSAILKEPRDHSLSLEERKKLVRGDVESWVVKNVTCGLSGSIAERIEDCNLKYPNDSTKLVENHLWTLVTILEEGIQYWRDIDSGNIWSQKLTSLYDRFSAEQICKKFNAKISDISSYHSLPSVYAFTNAMNNGLREVFPSENENIFLTSDKVGDIQVKVFNLENGKNWTESDDVLLNVKCLVLN